MSTEEERMQILEMIESGKISPADGVRLLQALSDRQEESGSELAPGTGVEAQSFSVPEPLDSQALPLTPVSQVGEGDLSWQAQNLAAAAPSINGQPDSAGVEPAGPPEEETEEEFIRPDPVPPLPAFDKWRKFWLIPLWIGAGITVVAGILMYLAYQASGIGFWFACTWFPFLFGVAVLAFAWASRTMRWLHVRVHQKPGEWPQTIAISLPLPLRLAAWGLGMFGDRIPNMKAERAREMLLAFENTSPDEPFYVKVDDDEDGEQVEVFIG